MVINSYRKSQTEKFEKYMDDFFLSGGKPEKLIFTPPTDRGANITRVEAFGLNMQRNFVPCLVDAGRWPVVKVDDDPSVMSNDQRYWLNLRWGEIARKWVDSYDTK